jgi:hypothetical protein
MHMPLKRLGAGLALALLTAILTPSARADFGVSALLGADYMAQPQDSAFRTISPILGGDAYYSLRDLVHLGAFIEYNRLAIDPAGDATLRFAGAFVRARLDSVERSNMFFDLKAGVATLSGDTIGRGSKIGFGVGLSYELPLSPVLSVRGRGGYRVLPSDTISRSFQLFEPAFLVTLKL